jgi:outer membrane protein assembly factor BamB
VGTGGGAAGQQGTGGGAGAAGSGGRATGASGTGQATNWAIDAAHDNDQPNDAVASPLTKAWTITFSGAPSYPLIAEGKVFVAADESQPDVRALSLATGAVVWGPIAIGAVVQLAYNQGRVYTLDGGGNVSALDASTGLHLWSTQITSQSFYWSAPVAADGLVWVEGLGFGGTLTALDGSNGKIVWSAGTFDGSDGTVAVGDSIVFEAEACDQVSAFNEATGTLGWYHSSSCTGGGGATPAYYNGWVWVRDWALGNIILDTLGNAHGSFLVDVPPSFDRGTAFYVRSNTVTAVDINTSAIKWSFSGDGMLNTMAAIAGGGQQVFMGSSSGNVYEIDETSGKQVSVDNAGAAVAAGSEKSAMAIGEGHLIVETATSLVVY